MTHAVTGCPGYLLVGEMGGKLLAQADPQLPLTGNQALALTLGLTLFVSSIMTGTLWCRRFFRTGHPLPQANRKFWRVPSTVTYFTGVLSLMWVLAQISVSFQAVEDQKPPEVVATTAATEPLTTVSDASVSAVSPDRGDILNSDTADSTVDQPAVKADKNAPTQEKLLSARDDLFAIILLNCLLSTLLGGSVILATMQERRRAAAQLVSESDGNTSTTFEDPLSASISADANSVSGRVPVPPPAFESPAVGTAESLFSRY